MNSQPTATWTAKQQRVALSIAAGKSIKAAAREAECGERTVHDWLADPRYDAFIFELRHRMLDQAVGSLADGTNAAVATLKGLLASKNENVRMRAALGILASVVQLREHVELGRRIGRLENAHGTESESIKIGGDDDDFADLFRVIKANDDDVSMARYIRENTPRRGRPGRNGHAEGNTTVP